MENMVSNSRAAHKHVLYRQAAQQVASLISGGDNPVGALANVTAVLNDTFYHYLWVGFYRVDGDVLKLDVFQGSPACYTIARGKGVCGTAWAMATTLIVPDVHNFPGHIACSSLSRSEIVVPVVREGRVVAVIDVDSDSLDAFDMADREGLEKIAAIVEPLL